MTDIDGPTHPIAVFVFKYRSKEDLKSELIIPRTPSPQPVRRGFQPISGVPESRESREARLKSLKVRFFLDKPDIVLI